MTSDRINEIQKTTAYPDSVSVYQALMQVWNECEQAESGSETQPKPEVKQNCLDCRNQDFNETMGCRNYAHFQEFRCENFKPEQSVTDCSQLNQDKPDEDDTTEDKLAEFYVESNGYTDMANRIDEYIKQQVIEILPTDEEICDKFKIEQDNPLFGLIGNVGARWMRDEIKRRLG